MRESLSLPVDADIKAMSDWMVELATTGKSMPFEEVVRFGRYSVQISEHGFFEATFQDESGSKWRFITCGSIAEKISRQTDTVIFDLFPVDGRLF